MKKPSNPKPKQAVIRVALIDDHTLLRETMKCILNAERGIHIVGDAAGRNEGMSMIARQKPSVVIQDICIGRDNGLEMLQEIKASHPDIKCLVLTGFTEDDFILKAIQHHADGYLLKTCSMPVLVNAIRQVASGHKIWDESILKRLTDLNTKKRSALTEIGMEILTLGEQEISRLVADGLTNREIGKKVHLAEKTIRNRVSLIMDKIQISRRSKLAALYTENLNRKR